jgi:cardiolipin synthase (CMP-forming)
MRTRILTVPNQLTFLRLTFLPLILILMIYDHYDWALAVMGIAALTDALDGLLARRLNQRTALGAYLDPIADKLLISSSFVVLSLKRRIHWWLTMIVLSRDVSILTIAAAIILVSGYKRFPPSIYGKATTFAEILMIFVVVAQAVFSGQVLGRTHEVLGYCVAVLTIVSGLQYSFSVARRMYATAS